MATHTVTKNYALQKGDQQLNVTKGDVTIFLRGPKALDHKETVRIHKTGPVKKIHISAIDTYMEREGKPIDVLIFGLTTHAETVVLEPHSDYWVVAQERDD